MNTMTAAATLLAATGLTACGTDDTQTEAFCAAFADAATATLACNAGCQLPADRAAVEDGNLDTAIAITPVANQTSATITLKNGGTDVPAGAVPGLFVTRPASGTRDTVLTTYVDDGPNPVDTSENAPQRVLESVDSGSGAATFLGLRTDDAFDEVRFTTSYDWQSNAVAPTYFLYEVCSHGGNE